MTGKEIVQELRCTSTPGSLHEDCTGCPYYRKEKLDAELKEKLGVDTWPSCDVNKVGMDAADLIERLTAENVVLPYGEVSAIESLRNEIEWKDMVIALAQRKQAEAEAERDALREKQRWIPVTERLPDERDAAIILLKDGQVFRGEIRERIALPEWWYFYDASDTDMDMLGVMYPLFDDGLWMHENPVVAWMPLPEAPEEGEKA